MARLFIGIFVPESLKQNILRLQREMEKLPSKAKFVERENLHISLSFLGEVDDAQIGSLESKLDGITKNYERFEARLSGIKLIPSESYVRVVALDVHDGLLQQVSKHIEKEIGGDVKPPHLTLCRVKKIEDMKLFLDKILQMNSGVGSFVVDSIDLIKSDLGEDGPVYTSLHKSSLY